MYLELQQQSILLGRRPSGFTEHYYTEWDDGLGKEKISLFLVMSIDSTQVPGAELGKEAFQLLQDHFLDDLTGDPYDRFESALREINLMVSEKEKELELKFIPNMQVIIGVIQKDMLFLSQRGVSQGYLVRKRHVSSITDGLFDAKNKEDLFQNIASGSMEVGDSVIFVTGPLVQYITPNDVSKIFSEQSLQAAVEEMADLLHHDLDEQMALLSFEILEKSHVATIDAPDAPKDASDYEYEDELSSDASSKDMRRSAGVLRQWLRNKERWAWFDRIRNWDTKKLIVAITSILGVLIVGIVLLNAGLGRGKQLNDLEAKLDSAEENITQAATRGAFDKTAANELLLAAEEMAIEVLNSGYLGGQASQLLDDIAEQRNYLDNIIEIDDELTLLADLSGLLGSTTIKGVQPMGENIVVYTPNEAYQVMLGDVQEPDVLDNSENVLAGAYFADRDNIVFVTDDGNVIEYTDGNAQFADTSDGSFYSAIDISAYSTKIYLLDPENDNIWKYTRGTAGYGSANSYMVEGEVDLSDAVSFAIDGSVWVLHEDGSISKILSGEDVPFYIMKAPLSSIAGSTDIYTELEINQIYVVDPDNDRLIMYDKSSEDISYNQQYVFSDLKGELTDVYVDKDRDVLIISTTQALYELGF